MLRRSVFIFSLVCGLGVLAITTWFFIDRWQDKSSIYSVDTLDLLWAEVDKLDAQSLVIFDIDRVLLTGADTIHRATKEERREIRGALKKLPHGHQARVRSRAILDRNRMLVDKKTPDLITLLQRKSIKVIALTACFTGKYHLIEHLEDTRLEEIKGFGFDFSSAFPNVESHEFTQLSYKQRHPMFKKGVLFASYCDKGNVLLAFLDWIGWRPSRIIFVDNKMKNVVSVKQAAKNLGIPFMGLHYKASYKLPHKFDKKLAQFQIQYLIDHETVLSDEEALELMQMQEVD